MIKKNRNSLNLAIISPIMSQANVNPFFNCVDIINSFSSKVHVIASFGENVLLRDKLDYEIHPIISFTTKNKIIRMFNYFTIQMKISIRLFLCKNRTISIFYMGEGLIIPIILEKISNKKIVLVLGGSIEEALSLTADPLYKYILFFKKISFWLSDTIIVYSPCLISKWKLDRYMGKISIAHEHYINFDQFYEKEKYENRGLLIGYIGSFSEIKGVLNFVQSIPSIINTNSNIKIILGGEGPLNDEIEQFIFNNKLTSIVNCIGWIPHKELANYLNKLKLLVLPSYTEGLPNIMLESMACGTPVLATSVGAIPDIIIDGERGFIMENNSVECIRTNVFRALNNSKLNTISNNSIKFIQQEFSYTKTANLFFESLANLIIASD